MLQVIDMRTVLDVVTQLENHEITVACLEVCLNAVLTSRPCVKYIMDHLSVLFAPALLLFTTLDFSRYQF